MNAEIPLTMVTEAPTYPGLVYLRFGLWFAGGAMALATAWLGYSRWSRHAGFEDAMGSRRRRWMALGVITGSGLAVFLLLHFLLPLVVPALDIGHVLSWWGLGYALSVVTVFAVLVASTVVAAAVVYSLYHRVEARIHGCFSGELALVGATLALWLAFLTTVAFGENEPVRMISHTGFLQETGGWTVRLDLHALVSMWLLVLALFLPPVAATVHESLHPSGQPSLYMVALAVYVVAWCASSVRWFFLLGVDGLWVQDTMWLTYLLAVAIPLLLAVSATRSRSRQRWYSVLLFALPGAFVMMVLIHAAVVDTEAFWRAVSI